jgi:hypothetical protein
MKYSLPLIILVASCISSCSRDQVKEEQIRVDYDPEGPEFDPSDTINAVKGNLPLSQIASYPRKVILNGLPQHRLVSIYKQVPKEKDQATSGYFDSYTKEYWSSDEYEHYMPGLDLQFGYNLLNVAHYDMKSEKLNYLFDKPVLVKSIYFPSYVEDSVGVKPKRVPIRRDYFMISVYDQDTNNDTLLNRHDLRRFYHFNASCDVKTQIIPPDYSVVRSQYDFDNDVMYIFARHDENQNGNTDSSEPLHIFWISLKSPAPAKRLY